MQIEHIWQVMYRSAYYEGGRVITGAMAAIDMALYDIVGKALKVPVYQLLGGACRDRIFGFCTVGGLNEPECMDRVKAAVDEGWPCIRFSRRRHYPRALRVDIHTTTRRTSSMCARRSRHRGTDHRGLREDAEGVVLGIDYHHRLSVVEAAQSANAFRAAASDFLKSPSATRILTPTPRCGP